MNITLLVFLVFVFTTFFNNAIQWYTHIETYPLQAWVGREEYNRYGQEYERRLIVALYIPYFVMFISNLILIFSHPDAINRLGFIITLPLNLSIMLVSFAFAVPLHRQHAKAGHVTHEGVKQLLRINLLRLGAATLSSICVLLMLVTLVA